MDSKTSYKKLGLTLFINFFVMYALTYAMVNSAEDIYININRFYMAAMMVAPMAIVMLLMMGKMYPDRRLNIVLGLISFCVFVLSFTFARSQIFVDNNQFLRSMIPHHSSAIVMCEDASITDEEIKALCKSIVEAQQREINQMNGILNRLNQ